MLATCASSNSSSGSSGCSPTSMLSRTVATEATIIPPGAVCSASSGRSLLMRTRRWTFVLLALVGGVACSSAKSNGFNADGGLDATAPFDGPQFSPDAVVSPDAFGQCATASFVGKQAPAAMVFVLDASGTMANGNKYASAQQ